VAHKKAKQQRNHKVGVLEKNELSEWNGERFEHSWNWWYVAASKNL